MDKMCQKPEEKDLNRSFETENEIENTKCGSPVFKCVTQVKSVKESILDSYDHDIPSYQVNQSVRSRTSSKYGNDTSDSVLSFCPIFSPIPFPSESQFRPHSAHSLKTIGKDKEKSVGNSVNDLLLNNNGNEVLKRGGIFESLGMLDKDISWVSSMASPPPKMVPGSEFNTLEKATFLPEKNFESIQPRALFSPTFDDDFGCHPISFTSESDDDEAYKSNIRLSDVCATLKQLEVKSHDQASNGSAEKIILQEESLISPVLRTKKKKHEIIKKIRKGALVVSPQDKNNHEFVMVENLEMLESDNEKSIDKNQAIEDDSFQSMSFSCIDELCKTLVTKQSDDFVRYKTSECDKTFVNERDMNSKVSKLVKKYYSTNTANDIYAVSSVDNLHLYAKALEEGDKYIPTGGKIDQSYADKGIVRFDILIKEIPKPDATKRLHSEVTEEKDESVEKKFKKLDDENSSWQNVKQYLSESQLNVSDGEIFRTVENLEKTLASQESKEMEKLREKVVQDGESLTVQNSHVLKTTDESFTGKNVEQEGSTDLKHSIDSLEGFRREEACDIKDAQKDLISVSFPAFTTASESKISMSEKSLNQGKDCEENLKNFNKVSTEYFCKFENKLKATVGTEEGFAGFSTLAGKQIKISAEALTKAKTLMLECEVAENSFRSDDCNKVSQNKFWESLTKNFSTNVGKQVSQTVTTDASGKEKSFVPECDEDGKKKASNVSESLSADLENLQAFEKILEETKDAVAKFNAQNEGPWMKGFKTGTGKLIQISAESLEKAKALMLECDDENLSRFAMNCADKPQAISFLQNQELEISEKHRIGNSDESAELNPASLKDFSTGLGKKISTPTKAGEEVEIFFKKSSEEFKKDFDELSTKSDKVSSNTTLDFSKGERKIRNCKKLESKEEDLKIPMMGFSSALGKKVRVSSKALEKAKTFWSKSDESVPEMEEFSAKLLPAFKTSSDFSTEDDSKLAMSEASLAKVKEQMSKLQDSRIFDCTTEEQKMLEKKPETSIIEEKQESEASNIWTDELDDWDAVIPSWLHVYKTSPSMASDTLEHSSINCDEDRKTITSIREYLVKSPILGSNDRFYGKVKRRKLRFEEKKKIEDKTQSGCKDAGRKPNSKRISNLSLDFSTPFKRIKIVDGLKTVDADVKEKRARAREEQEKIVREKQKVKPLEGSHLRKKVAEKQMKWTEAVGKCFPESHSEQYLRSLGVKEDVLRVNVENAMAFKFSGESYFGPETCLQNTKGIPVGDECLLILNDENKVGREEIKRAFLASPGVQPNLLSRGWVENHYKWIVWKLAHYERAFPLYFGGRCLTPNQVLLQLKYRYDREIDRNERSALKKILERDDSSIKRLVLCVCNVKKVTMNETVGYELELTDGWYSCPARSDPAMSRLIEEGKLSIGTKLLTQGAVLVNCEQGISPLEISKDVYLKISTNSTRRIRWDTKLGFQKNPENFPISLASILAQGGTISRIDVIIVRIYPMLFKEKTTDGHHVTRNRRSEEKADAEFRRIQEQKMEIIFSEIQSEMRKSINFEKKSNENTLNDLEQVDDLCRLTEAKPHSSASQDMLLDQRKLLEKLQSNEKDRFTRDLAEKIDKELEKEKLKKRNVSQFLRVKIVDFRKPDYNNPALLSVWNPSEDLISLLTEGRVVSVMNVTISNSSRIYKPMQLNTTRQTQFRHISKSVKYPVRKLMPLKSVSSKICPAFEEVDMVGMVILIRDVSYGSRLSQVVYLTDLEMNFVGVVFWGNCKDFGWENVLGISSIVACSNLMWKKNYIFQDVPSVYVNENSVFTKNPKQEYLKEELERLKQNLPKDLKAFLTKCEEDLTVKLEETKWRANTSKVSSNNSSLRENHSIKAQLVNGFESKPTASSTPIKPFTFRSISDDAEPSPIQKRIEKLQCYGEPSPLIPLVVRNNIKKKFKKRVKPLGNESVS